MKKIIGFIGLASICNFFISGIVYAQQGAAVPSSRGADQSFRAGTNGHEKAVAKQDKRDATVDMGDLAQSKADIAVQKTSEGKIKAEAHPKAVKAEKSSPAPAPAPAAAAAAAAAAELGGTREGATGAGAPNEASADICKQKPELLRCPVNGGTK